MKAAGRAYIKTDVLNTWKEIAEYLQRGVRTVQRWERDLKLPVRRPRGKRRSAVLAIPKEIDAWLGCCPQMRSHAENSGPLTATTSSAGAVDPSPDLPSSKPADSEPLLRLSQ